MRFFLVSPILAGKTNIVGKPLKLKTMKISKIYRKILNVQEEL